MVLEAFLNYQVYRESGVSARSSLGIVRNTVGARSDSLRHLGAAARCKRVCLTHP